MKKIGIFWGSFDPPHMGHVFAAVQALNTIKINELWVIPVFKHPFGKELSSFNDRMIMCYCAFAAVNRCFVKEFDSYNKTGQCLELLQILHNYSDKVLKGQAEFVMLGGTDVDSNNSKHKDIEEIKKLCTVARVPRASYSGSKYAIPNYSSSEIRQLVKEGKSIEGLVSLSVEDYITRHGALYKENKNA
jgi:nicotinate-nucleotide adenylyltransferase